MRFARILAATVTSADLVFPTAALSTAPADASTAPAAAKMTRYSRVFYKVGAPRTGRWHFRVGTPARKLYRVSYSAVFYTYRY